LGGSVLASFASVLVNVIAVGSNASVLPPISHSVVRYGLNWGLGRPSIQIRYGFTK